MIALNKHGWKIQTASGGFVNFAGIAPMGVKNMWRVSFEDGSHIDASADHAFFTEDDRPITVKELNVSVTLKGLPPKRISSIHNIGEQIAFDIIESETHTFLANGVESHNCQFISSEKSLVDQIVLARLTEQVGMKKPIAKVKVKDNTIYFWKNISRGQTYLVCVDPATGTGSDYSVIEVFDFPLLTQVAEFRSNKITTPDLYKTLKSLIVYLGNKNSNQVFFTFENNGIGEGLAALYMQDEKAPIAELLSEDGSKRLGFSTTGKSKLPNCVKFKDMVEIDRIKLCSMATVRELKSFVKKGASYAALPGGTDDCVTASMLVVRMVEVMASFDDKAHTALFDTNTDNIEEWDLETRMKKQGTGIGEQSYDDEYEEPMPML